ncbi:hypothetical protein K3495_g15684 [Podosphaera aphanis]|nr:hypothetical protein K3495_g15684 [Podosphaera aphanis]
MSKANSKASAPSRLSNSGNMLNPQNGIYEYDGFNIEPDVWGHPINISKPLSQPIVNTYILWRIKVYTRNKLRDYQLWELFQGDFEGWTKQIFDFSDKGVIQRLCDHLLANGVWIDRRRGLYMSKALSQTLSEENPTKWTTEEIER